MAYASSGDFEMMQFMQDFFFLIAVYHAIFLATALIFLVASYDGRRFLSSMWKANFGKEDMYG